MYIRACESVAVDIREFKQINSLCFNQPYCSIIDMAPKLTLYRVNGACSLVPHILLTELNIPFDEVLLKFDFPKGFTSADGSFTLEDYLKIHPFGYVPALKIDNEVLTENGAVQFYIQSFAPERHLFGKTPMEQARVVEWMNYIAVTIHGNGIAMWGRPNRFTDNEEHYGSIKEKGEKTLHSCFREVEKRLGDKEFAVGTQDTLADYYLLYFYFVAQSPFVGFKMGQYQNYTRHTKRMMQKDSVKKVLEKEGLSVSYD